LGVVFRDTRAGDSLFNLKGENNMLKKTINYEDFDGNKQVEDAYFNLTKTELIEMAIDLPDDVSNSVGTDPDKVDEEAAVAKIMETMGKKGILKFIKDLVLKSYGIKSEDGKRFIKEDENGKPLSREFSQTMAFEAIMEEFLSDDIAAAAFVNGVIPASAADKVPQLKATKTKAQADK
jgi:hypothetical protein